MSPFIATFLFALTAALPRWSGVIVAPSEGSDAYDVHGTATMEADGPRNTLVSVKITHAGSGEEHAWALYRGACGDDSQMVTPQADYSELYVGENGNAGAAAELNFSLPTEGAFHVNVRAGADKAGPLAGCADLKIAK